MKIEGEGKLLRIFVGESDRWQGQPLYEAIVRTVRERGLAGATVIRGVQGFGANSRIHTTAEVPPRKQYQVIRRGKRWLGKRRQSIPVSAMPAVLTCKRLHEEEGRRYPAGRD